MAVITFRKDGEPMKLAQVTVSHVGKKEVGETYRTDAFGQIFIKDSGLGSRFIFTVNSVLIPVPYYLEMNMVIDLSAELASSADA